MASMNLLLLLSEHEPVEGAHYKVAYDCHCVQQVMSGLHIDSTVRRLQGFLAEIDSIARCRDTAV